jgi:hypothetical protein
MRSFFLRIIVIEHHSAGGFPLEEASEHCLLSIKVLFQCCGVTYCVSFLLFSAIYMFSYFIIDVVPYTDTSNLFSLLQIYKSMKHDKKAYANIINH